MKNLSQVRNGSDMQAWLQSARSEGYYVTAEAFQLKDDPQWGDELILAIRYSENESDVVEQEPNFIFTRRKDWFVAFWELIGACQAGADEFDDEDVLV